MEGWTARITKRRGKSRRWLDSVKGSLSPEIGRREGGRRGRRGVALGVRGLTSRNW